ncbi:hypothetical protein [Actinomadura harenae]|uniref:hypothetical protein n=1 Tax=Actinomadura harenae TaxID=2483351 RepID=UPI0018F6078D|nr:hypothetical protein [Actinomadura harenae]
MNELVEAADDKPLIKTIARYGRGAELLFRVLTKREEKNSLAVAPNEAFGGTIIETGADSHRFAQPRARARAAG